MSSKIIQISTTWISDAGNSCFVRTVLCEDGSIWESEGGGDFHEVSPPYDSARTASCPSCHYIFTVEEV